MDRDFPWMWSEACAMLVRAERLNRDFFRPGSPVSSMPVWEPPVDILETDNEVLVFVALPGVNPDGVQAVIEDAHLIIQGVRALPPQLRTAEIHRLELPQGRFARRVRLPAGRYTDVTRTAVDGCLVIALQKMEARRG